jgi:hypothetical protein
MACSPACQGSRHVSTCVPTFWPALMVVAYQAWLAPTGKRLN